MSKYGHLFKDYPNCLVLSFASLYKSFRFLTLPFLRFYFQLYKGDINFVSMLRFYSQLKIFHPNLYQNFVFNHMLIIHSTNCYMTCMTIFIFASMIQTNRTSVSGHRSTNQTLIISRLAERQDRNICWKTSLICRTRWRMSNIYCIWIVGDKTVEKAFSQLGGCK